MISEQRIKDIEEASTGTELFEAIASAFESYGFGAIGSSDSLTPTEITLSEYEELPIPDGTSYIYLVTDG